MGGKDPRGGRGKGRVGTQGKWPGARITPPSAESVHDPVLPGRGRPTTAHQRLVQELSQRRHLSQQQFEIPSCSISNRLGPPPRFRPKPSWTGLARFRRRQINGFHPGLLGH